MLCVAYLLPLFSATCASPLLAPCIFAGWFLSAAGSCTNLEGAGCSFFATCFVYSLGLSHGFSTISDMQACVCCRDLYEMLAAPLQFPSVSCSPISLDKLAPLCCSYLNRYPLGLLTTQANSVSASNLYYSVNVGPVHMVVLR